MSVENGAVEVQEVVLKPDDRDKNVSPDVQHLLPESSRSECPRVHVYVCPTCTLASYAEAFVDGASYCGSQLANPSFRCRLIGDSKGFDNQLSGAICLM